ncbi:MAG: hypothetical protein ACKOFI_05360, partial [Phycisphaerales bacterium]
GARGGPAPRRVVPPGRPPGPGRGLAHRPPPGAARRAHGERLVEQRLIPRVLMPLRARLDRG